MFTPELLEEIRQVLSKVRVARRLSVTEVAARMKEDATEVDRVLVGRVSMTAEMGERIAEALNIRELWWHEVRAVAKARLDHNRMYSDAVQRLADLGAVTDRTGV